MTMLFGSNGAVMVCLYESIRVSIRGNYRSDISVQTSRSADEKDGT
ncbi:MAG: hypothetical protein ABR980_14690 [Ignavibacteriaceae bacterium]